MVKPKENIVGRKFSMLTVLEQVEDKVGSDGRHRDRYLCLCDCGNKCVATGQLLKRGATQSCGCLKNEVGNKIKKYNKYDMSGEYGVGFTRNKNEPFYFDKEDFDKIKNYCWSSNKSKKDGYVKLCARDAQTRKLIKFHKIVFGVNVDHINRNTLDNRKENLRFATPSQQNYNKGLNARNTTGYTGVQVDKRTGKFRAQIKICGKVYYSKLCETKEEAAIERKKLEEKFCGEFANKI